MTTRLAIVATDGSEAAVAAARAALSLLHPDLEVQLVTVVEPAYDPVQDEGGFEGPVMSEEQAEDEHRQAVAAASGALAATAAAVEPVAHTELVTSPERPADALLHLAAERDAAVLVVGHEQHGILRELFAGSVSGRLVHRSPCPVLVVPHRS